jgi:hypothetical protein
MKKFSMMVLGLALTASASASAATYTCTGTQDTQGGVRVFMNNSGMAIFGTYVDSDTKKPVRVQCESHTGKVRGQFLYAQTQKSVTCPIDYVRIPSYINDPKGGIIAIVDRTGADNHDYSGYAYQYFYCKQ